MDKLPLPRLADYTTEGGANLLAARIREFWRARGLFPNVWVQQNLVSKNGTERFWWEVRSSIRMTGEAWTGKFGAQV